MALVFHHFLNESTGDASYLVGDDTARTCAIVDPQIDVGKYLEAAREHGLAIRHVVQTHTHEDFFSGALALVAQLPGADIGVSGHGDSEYGFPHRTLYDGDELELGSVRLKILHTPGHTPEHISLLVSKDGEEAPFAVLSGGALLVGTAGRTDLLGPERTDELTKQQFETLHGVFLNFPDGVQVYPTHVHGSPCGAAIGDKPSTKIAREKATNKLLQQSDEVAFKRAALDELNRPDF
jgi:hydroxyacylglutathione hydrolase